VILVVDLCGAKNSLHRAEFVQPVMSVVQGAGKQVKAVHFTDLEQELDIHPPHGPSCIILCGTALRDNAYQHHLAAFARLKNVKCTILGICAGMHIVGMLWGGKLVEERRIGVYPFEPVPDRFIFDVERPGGYHLHNYSVSIPEDFMVLAKSSGLPVIVKHRKDDIYGVLFHPEVLNHSIIEQVIDM